MEQNIQGTAAARSLPSAASTSPSPAQTSHELDALTFGAENVLKTVATLQVESLRFAARRTFAYLEFMRNVCHCKGPEEVGSLQRAFFKDLVADYGEEAGRFAGTGLQLATSGLGPLQWLFYRQTPKAKRGNGAVR